jgi:hypothetical protein
MPLTGVAVASRFEMETLLPPPSDGGRYPTYGELNKAM